MKLEELKTGDYIKILNRCNYYSLLLSDIYRVDEINILHNNLQLYGRLDNKKNKPIDFYWSCSDDDFEKADPMDYLEPYDIIKNVVGIDCSYIMHSKGYDNAIRIEAEILSSYEFDPGTLSSWAKDSGYKSLYTGLSSYSNPEHFTFVEKRWGVPKTNVKGYVDEKKIDFSHIPYDIGDQVIYNRCDKQHLGKVTGFIEGHVSILVEFYDTSLSFLHHGHFSEYTVYDRKGNILDLKDNGNKYYYCYVDHLKPVGKELSDISLPAIVDVPDKTETAAKNWRFKTKQELLDENGEGFRKRKPTWPFEMDSLFGKPYTGKFPAERSYEPFAGWTIAKWMLTHKPLPGNICDVTIGNLPKETIVEDTGVYYMGVDPVKESSPTSQEILKEYDRVLATGLGLISTQDCEKDTSDDLVNESSYFDIVEPLQENDLLDFD